MCACMCYFCTFCVGSFNGLEIEITIEGDVIIIVDLQRALPVPVHLVLLYRDLENPSSPPHRVTTQAAYLNITEIRHIEFASRVPFEHFTVEVGLFSRGVRGPLIRARGEFGTYINYILYSSPLLCGC